MSEAAEVTLVPLTVTKDPDHVFTYDFAEATATHHDLPVAFTLGKVRTWHGVDGQGTEAELKLDGKVIGHLVCEGHGDGVYYRPSVPWAEGHAKVDVLIEDARQRKAEGEFFMHEGLWNDMLEEHAALKRLTAQFKGTKSRPGKIAVIKNGTPLVDNEIYGTVFKEPQWWTLRAAPSQIDSLRPRLKKDGFTHWFDGEKWATL